MILLATLALAAPVVDVNRLLSQSADLSLLARRAPYRVAQASSMDPAAFTSDPFANGDAGHFLRQEGQERVMADLKGPGAVVRLWSANPSGTIRFYFDGEATPRLQAPMKELMSGRYPGIPEPFAYEAAQGFNVYFPFPYSRSLKITAEGPETGSLYYHVGYRSYERGNGVRTFRMADVRPDVRNAVAQALQPNERAIEFPKPTVLAPGQKFERSISTSHLRAVRQLAVRIPFPLVQSLRPLDWNDPHNPHNVLRKVILRLTFDGQTTVRAPLGDFFATAPGLNALRTLPFEVRPDGTMICRLPMPFGQKFALELENRNPIDVPVSVQFETERTSALDVYRLHARWVAEEGPTRPMRHMEMLDVRGEGNYVGMHLHVANPVPLWWGEGDERFTVDGEARPSTFGTGTEDYFGYAWCSTRLFERPYHAQPRMDGPGNQRHTSVMRWHVLDPIPYRKSLHYDMELWHWADTRVTMARTVYWYAPPQTTLPEEPKGPLEPPLLLPKAPVPGVLEGERLEVVERTGGELQVQDQFWEPSEGKQLWWTFMNVNDRLVLRVPVAEAGKYRVVGSFCHAPDYGIHRLTLAGQPLGEHDFRFWKIEWKEIELGTVDLLAGSATLEVVCRGGHPEAPPGRMFGLDYLKLIKVNP